MMWSVFATAALAAVFFGCITRLNSIRAAIGDAEPWGWAILAGGIVLRVAGYWSTARGTEYGDEIMQVGMGVLACCYMRGKWRDVLPKVGTWSGQERRRVNNASEAISDHWRDRAERL
jgi:hypothetical protein